MIRLAVFLGNYGREYAHTRHNAAWLFGDSLPFADSLVWQKKFKGHYCLRNDIYFLKPETYMNLSGESIAPLAQFYKIIPEEILLIHDELELPTGTVSLKWSGGLGGHNGLRSAKTCLGTTDFWRFRIGIGRPEHGDVSNYVLSDFTEDEKIILSQIFPPLSDFFDHLLNEKDPTTLIKDWGKKNLLI